MNDLYILLCFVGEILSLGDLSLRAYRELSEIVYCTYTHLSVLAFMLLMDLCIYSFGLEYRSLEPTTLI